MTKNNKLLDAVENGDLKEVERLVEHGANIHAKDDLALGWASYWGHLEVVKYLVEAGANIHAYNNEALKVAKEKDYIKIVEYLTYCKSLYYKMKIRRK